MRKKYLVRLSEAERAELEALVKTGRTAVRKRLHAQILLKADEGERSPAWSDAAIRKALKQTPSRWARSLPKPKTSPLTPQNPKVAHWRMPLYSFASPSLATLH